jgi:RNA recognition motif-containing protein
MGKKLYVGNLPFSVTDEALQQIFSQVGAVESVRIITDRDTGRAKGFGFVEMVNEQDAAAAISKFNGTDYEGRALTVSEARPQTPREGGGFRSGQGSKRSGNGGFSGRKRW